ncbi:MAG TPA: GTP 3',8-cyclase MoaA [Dehalococcoidales bacterium]|nr:GTP 3',8-cyclase MoaA [Dehalococcoidales bacterium]
MTGLSDSFQRPINYMRVSVTDRCNFRCIYCMPEEGVPWMPHQDILTFEESLTVIRAASEMGINRIRITGGEPLIRKGIVNFVKMVAELPGMQDISLTTNGIYLPQYAAELKQAGLTRVNVSLDTLNPEKFRRICRSVRPGGDLEKVLEGIKVANQVGLKPVKINMVVMVGINDEEILNFASRTIDNEWHVRFIELMPYTGHHGRSPTSLPAREIKKRLDPLGKMEPYNHEKGNGPAKYYRFAEAKGTIGFINAISEHFCVSCNRLRLTADGKLRPCLMSETMIDLREPLRSGISSEKLKELIQQAVQAKPLEHHLVEGQRPNDRPFCQVGG